MKPHRVVVADRNPAFLEKTAEILSSAGVGMIPIDNGGRVLTLCRHEQPDAVLLHVDLPALPGTEVCQRIKTQLDAALPVVLMFPEERPNLEELAARCLADNFLVRSWAVAGAGSASTSSFTSSGWRSSGWSATASR